MSVLIDTSVWCEHFRTRNDFLVQITQQDRALTHPMVIGELACGTPPQPRSISLGAIELLRGVNLASTDEVREFIERETLFGLGCGWVDLCLLASTLITPGASLWTLDKRLASLAERFGVAFIRPIH
jgi:predicted nucleic acid-binding protein